MLQCFGLGLGLGFLVWTPSVLQYIPSSKNRLTSVDKFAFTVYCLVQVRGAGDNLVIHGRHEIRSDGKGGEIAREVHRSYRLPEDVDPKGIKSSLDTRGVLTITASKRK